MMNEKFDAVIVANGQFPSHTIPLDILKNASHIVCCDGAITHLSPLLPQLSSLIIIGDGDSVPAEYRDRLIQIDEQDDNDQTKATRYCVEKGWKHIAYLGSTGLREDHTLGNISLLMRYYRELGVEGRMFTDHGFFTPAFGNRTFQCMKGQQVSIFNFGCHQLTSEGLRWSTFDFDEWWQGTLNEALSNTFTLHADNYYLVYQTYNIK
jgi:thiamine pyrophosphokinase